MPRKPKGQPTTLPLCDSTIAISGSFGTGKTHPVIAGLISTFGGQFSSTVTDKCTHLVVPSAAEVEKNGVKVVQAKQVVGLKIVLFDWLDQSSRQARKLDEAAFEVGRPDGQDGVGQDVGQGKVKQEDDVDDGEKENEQVGSVKRRGRARKTDSNDSSLKSAVDTPIKSEKKRDGAGANGDVDGNTAGPDGNTDDATPSKRRRVGRSRPGIDEKAEPTTKKEAADDIQPSAPTGHPDKPTAAVLAPIDPACPLTDYIVYCADDGTVYDGSLSQTNAGRNNNKFYLVQLIHNDGRTDFKTWTRWGRVGEKGQSKMLGDGTLADTTVAFGKKFREKSGLTWENRTDEPKKGKYVFVERSYEPDDDDKADQPADPTGPIDDDDEEEQATVESTLHPDVQSLMTFIFNPALFEDTFRDLNYDANKLPLGKLGKHTISRGFETLKALADMFAASALPSHSAVEDLSNRYYSYIPHDFGRFRPPVISSMNVLKKEVSLLESLSDMKAAADIIKLASQKSSGPRVHPLDQRFAALGMDEMESLDPTGSEFKLLKDYLVDTRGTTHQINYKIDQIFRITRKFEPDRFIKPENFSDLFKRTSRTPSSSSSPTGLPGSNRRLLWHGSRATNFGGILSQGLRIAPPEAPVSGYMFGKGVYLADMSSKSAGYCCAGISNNVGLLLLCEAELGDPMLQLVNADSDAGKRANQSGSLATIGQGRYGPLKWKDAKAVHPTLEGVMMPDTLEPPTSTGIDNTSLYYNEYICYNVAQIRMRYLFRVKME